MHPPVVVYFAATNALNQRNAAETLWIFRKYIHSTFPVLWHEFDSIAPLATHNRQILLARKKLRRIKINISDENLPRMLSDIDEWVELLVKRPLCLACSILFVLTLRRSVWRYWRQLVVWRFSHREHAHHSTTVYTLLRIFVLFRIHLLFAFWGCVNKRRGIFNPNECQGLCYSKTRIWSVRGGGCERKRVEKKRNIWLLLLFLRCTQYHRNRRALNLDGTRNSYVNNE